MEYPDVARTDPAARLAGLNDSLETWQRELRHMNAFLEDLDAAEKDDLRDWFGDVMADARSTDRDMVEVRIDFDDDVGEPGIPDDVESDPRDADDYLDLQHDAVFRVPADGALSYDELGARAIAEIAELADVAEKQVDNLTELVQEASDDVDGDGSTTIATVRDPDAVPADRADDVDGEE